MITAWSPDFLRGIAEGLFLPLRMEDIPNMEDVADFHRDGHGMGLDTSYGVPFECAFMGIFYNKKALGFVPTDWADLWRPEAQGKLGFNTSFWPVWLVRWPLE